MQESIENIQFYKTSEVFTYHEIIVRSLKIFFRKNTIQNNLSKFSQYVEKINVRNTFHVLVT